MKNGCQCNCSSNCNKDLIVITIQSGGNNKKNKSKNRQSVADAYSEAPEPDSDSVDTVDSHKSSALTPGSYNRDPSRHSVAEAKHVSKIQQRLYKLPIVCDRHHGPGCAMEICVLEKHEDSCMFKKEENSGRNLKDDRVGSYDCIGRMVFKTCNEDGNHRPKPSILVTSPSRGTVHRVRSRNDDFDPDKQVIGGVIAEKAEPRRPSVYSQPSKMSSMRQVHEYNEDGVEEEPVRAKSASRTYQTPFRQALRARQETAASPWKSYGDSGPACTSSSYKNNQAPSKDSTSVYNNSEALGKVTSSGYGNNSASFGKAPRPSYYEHQEEAHCNGPAAAPPWRSYGDSGPACTSSSYENRQGFSRMTRPPERREPSSVPLVFSFNKKTQCQADEANQTPLYFSYIKTTSDDSLSSYENLTTKKKYGSGLIAGLFGSSRRKTHQHKNKSKYHK